MAQKYYVVWVGRETGIFTDWDTCKKQIDKFAGAKYKSFKTQSEAQSAFGGSSTTTVTTAAKKPARKKSTAQTVKTYTGAEIAKLAFDTKIFTDGGCEPNPGEAGSGLAVYRNNAVDELWFGLYNPTGTNNTAELNALHQALLMAEEEIKKNKSVAIFCDSKYSIQCITQWAISWQKNGWVKKGGEIKNLELIKEMFALYMQLKDSIQVLHVNGHVGVEGNELADRMSMIAIEAKETNFARYREALDVNAILAIRAG